MFPWKFVHTGSSCMSIPSAVSISTLVTSPSNPLQIMLRRGFASQYRTRHRFANPLAVPSNLSGGGTHPFRGALP